METAVLDYLAELGDAFVNPQKRVFIGYLLAALAIACAVIAFSAGTGLRAGLGEGWRRVFDRKIWWSASARGDYRLFLANQAVMMALVPFLVTQVALAAVLFETLHGMAGGRPMLWAALPGWGVALLFTVAHFILDDATKYLVHRALHRWPVLWAFHKVHHSAETMTPLTVYRTHPVEGLLFTLRGIFVQAVVIAVFVYYFGDRVDLVTVLGANLFVFVFNVTGANLRHSHISIGYGRVLERLLISPAQHQLHHSSDPRHHDRNFGMALAVWDWVGGSLHLSEKNTVLRFGLGTELSETAHGIKSLYGQPLQEAARVIHDTCHTGTRKMMNALVLATGRVGPAIRSRARLFALLLALSAVFYPAGTRAAEELNIYSHRQPFLINPFIDAYTAKTGVKVNIVYASRGLAQRLQAERENSPADVVLTVDIGRLMVYADKDLLAPVESALLEKNIPEHLRDPKGRWFALSKRARVVAVAKGRVDPSEIARIEDLADPKWKDRICSRPGSHVYNRALMASLIAAHGEAKAEEWARGFVANLARRPQGDDRAQVKAVFEGVCDIAIINNYYFGKLMVDEDPEKRAWADAVNIVFTNQDDRGNHINISGGGVAKYSQRKQLAVGFLEFLSGMEAQRLYGEINFEYPVNPEVPAAPELKALGDFSEDQLPIGRIAQLAPAAQKIIDRVGW
ncbi:MAG: extracellular solute-binding protein [Alphaproteobacteria bacterium]